MPNGGSPLDDTWFPFMPQAFLYGLRPKAKMAAISSQMP